MHHAEAVDPREDARRPLSAAGATTAERVASAATAQGFLPEVIWHSGKLRAKQTAEALWLAGDHRAAIAAVRGLQPDDPPEWMADRLAGETRTIAVVGHMPHLPALLARLTARSVAAPVDFPLHGCVGLAPDGVRWREVWRASAR